MIPSNPVTTTPTSSSSSSSADNVTTDSLDSLANESTFLQLLVSQIQNQDPLNPTDSAQFLGQLTEMSQLEQLIGIRQDIQGGDSVTGTTGTNSTTPTS
jgi:flagellar basal-body rod modification protein FlgD